MDGSTEDEVTSPPEERENAEQARIILKALRFDDRFPQIVRTDSAHGIVCEELA
jgi:hypothetical protein